MSDRSRNVCTEAPARRTRAPGRTSARPEPLAFGLLVALTLAAALVGCASAPADLPRGAPGVALSAAPTGPLAEFEAAFARTHGAQRSGFHVLDTNVDALRWRLALIDSAERSIDVQTYLWNGDEGGLLVMKRLVSAAERGVKVRVLLDDLSTILIGETKPAKGDAAPARLDAHPNIEVRLFNPWQLRSLWARALEALLHLPRLNRRMHNKAIVADNRVAILGGRNIGNEYFGMSTDFNFRDLDMLGVGPVARQTSATFDRYWNSEWVTPLSAVAESRTQRELTYEMQVARQRLRAKESLGRFAIERQDWRASFAALAPRLYPGASRVEADQPDPQGPEHRVPVAVSKLIANARRDVLISNSYVIPDEDFIDELRALTARGVRIRLLTNSLASQDVPAVNSHYKAWRRRLIEAGVQLHEMRHDGLVQQLLADSPPTSAKRVGHHVKAIVVDGERAFVGSMNLDPRSMRINSEVGVVVESVELARALEATIERDLQPANSWRVVLDAGGSPRWVAGDQALARQPALGVGQRAKDLLYRLLPRELY